MAAVALEMITVGFSGAMDALDLVISAHQALAKRHGDQFRGLERRIEAIIEDGDLGKTDMHDLGDGEFELSAPSKLTELIRDARELGVIQ